MTRNKNNEPEWDPDMEQLMKLLLSKKGIKTKSASEVGRKKVDYFRGKDFKKFLLSKGDILKKKCPNAMKACCGDGIVQKDKDAKDKDAEIPVPETEKDVEKIGFELMSKGFCVKALYKPVNPSARDTGSGVKKRWPDRLQRAAAQSFDSEGYYIVIYEGGSGMQHFLLALLIVCVLLACMFPAWPMWAKIGIWYLSVIFLSLYFGILILRMVIFTAFWIVGFDFWIFPNINDEYCGFLDSFQPLYSWEKRKDDILMILVRLGSLVIVAAAAHEIGQTHSLSDVKDFVTSSYADIIDWGVDKLTALPGSERQALPSVEELKDQVKMDEKEDDDDAEPVSAKQAEAKKGPEVSEEDTVDVEA